MSLVSHGTVTVKLMAECSESVSFTEDVGTIQSRLCSLGSCLQMPGIFWVGCWLAGSPEFSLSHCFWQGSQAGWALVTPGLAVVSSAALVIVACSATTAGVMAVLYRGGKQGSGKVFARVCGTPPDPVLMTPATAGHIVHLL